MRNILPVSVLSCTLFTALAQTAPPLLPPDARYKADVLIVFAHPDDDVVIGGYLARISLDQRKRVAVVYCTNGDGGGNAVGNEAGAALGEMRMIEARRALGAWGIENIWFLTGHDTPGQNVLWSLDNWNHGRALDEVVRLVRLTRPEVILTWLPDYVVGENHDDHQASGVLATEAFDLAGDPTWFPEQVSPARDRTGMMNLTEGLLPWQPQKLYYATDAFEDFGPYWHNSKQLSPFRKNMLDGRGPRYETTTISPSKHVSYARLTVDQQLFYQTQEAYLAEQALKNRTLKDFEYPVRLIFGKSVAGGPVTGDVFENVSPVPAAFTRVRGHEPPHAAGLSFEIGDPWRFYSLFWKAHDLDHLAELLPVPEAAARFGGALRIPLRICNSTTAEREIAVAASAPAGWQDGTPFSRYPVRPGECYPAQARLMMPASGTEGWHEVHWTATSGTDVVGHVDLRVFLGNSGGLPQ
jgi:LmbE family N-acetylglucosaminyl deacetylase